MRLTVSKDFFLQFASRTWLSPFSVVRELVEDCFDEDATRVIVTLGESYAVVEDDVGMDAEALEKFLVVGSIHKQFEPYSPRFNRPRTGRYGTGRLSFLASFEAMKVRTRKGSFSISILIDEDCISGLTVGSSDVKVLNEPPLERDGSEIWLLGAKSSLDAKRIIKELRGLPILREPFFEVWVRVGGFKPWSLEGAVKLEPPEILGEKIQVSLENITGEITIADRPLSDEERGIAVLHGGHMVTRSLFGFPPSQMSRITGWVRCDWLTVRFADKAGIIEDASYERFTSILRRFIASEVLPKAARAEDALSYSEVQAFRTVDKVLSMVLEATSEKPEKPVEQLPEQPPAQAVSAQPEAEPPINAPPITEPPITTPPITTPPITEPPTQPSLNVQGGQPATPGVQPAQSVANAQLRPPTAEPMLEAADARRKSAQYRRVSLRLGYTVLPYSSEEDDREFFVDGKTIFVNKKHPAYIKELSHGRDFLVRYLLRIVASSLAIEKCPQQTGALEEANRLIAEALKKL